MADIDMERRERKKNNGKLWFWLIVVIVGIVVAWLAFSERNNVTDEEVPPEPVVLRINSSQVV